MMRFCFRSFFVISGLEREKVKRGETHREGNMR